MLEGVEDTERVGGEQGKGGKCHYILCQKYSCFLTRPNFGSKENLHMSRYDSLNIISSHHKISQKPM